MTQPAFSDDKPTDGTVEYRGSSSSPTRVIMILAVGLFAVLLVWALRPTGQFGNGATHPAVGQAMGSFELAPLVGDLAPVTLESLRGEIVLINFWGTWCGPCLIEFPHLVEMNDRLKTEHRFRFVPVSCGPGSVDRDIEQLQDATEAYYARIDADLDAYADPRAGARMSLVKAAQLPGFSFPMTVLLGPDGTIQGLWQGYRPGVEAEMEEVIKALLKSLRQST